jgi:hypothetical protein
MVVVISFIHEDVCATTSDYISGVGSVASVYAIMITLWQFVKKTDEIKEAVTAKTKEISSFLTYAEIERHKEMCNSVYNSINGGQYEAAAMKLDEIRSLLIEMRKRRPDGVDLNDVNKAISDIGNDSVNLRNRWISNEELDCKVVFKHINRVSNILSIISASIKSEQL